MGILRALFGGRRAPRSDEPDDHPVAWDEIPQDVREAIGGALPSGHSVWRCPRHDGRGGVVIEWWWHDEGGEPIEAFWSLQPASCSDVLRAGTGPAQAARLPPHRPSPTMPRCRRRSPSR